MPKDNKWINKGFFSYMALILGILLLCFALIWIIWIAPNIKKLPRDFSYYADIFSVDNLYDEETKKFQGEYISKTQFRYDTVKINDNNYLIKNSFSVLRLDDSPIFSVERTYQVNPYTGAHTGNDDEKRTGFLFAPHYVGKKNYTYWHINYNLPIHLTYQNSENILGLNVNRFASHFIVDQSKELSYLPDVPELRFAKTNVDLQVWVEPVSGWLVKYQDKGTVNLYDKNTNVKIFPWNQYSNRYTIGSIRDQVKIAKNLKNKYLIVDFVIPSFLILLSITCLLIYYKKFPKMEFKSKIKLDFILPGFISVLFIIAISATLSNLVIPKVEIKKVGIAKWNNTLDIDEMIRGFKDGLAEEGFIDGKNIHYIFSDAEGNIETEISIMEMMLSKNVSLIYTQTTKGTLIAKSMRKKIPIIFSNVTYPKQASLTSSSYSKHLVGTSNYISPAQQYYFFDRIYPNTTTLAYIHAKNDPNSNIQLNEFKKMLDKRGVVTLDIEAIDVEDIVKQLEKNSNINAIYLSCDRLIDHGSDKAIIDYALSKKIPTFSCNKQSVMDGALVAYMIDPYVEGKLAGKKASYILQGAKAYWLQTESPYVGYLIINEKTAKLLNLTVPKDIEPSINQIVTQ